jgi:hypothetical protein
MTGEFAYCLKSSILVYPLQEWDNTVASLGLTAVLARVRTEFSVLDELPRKIMVFGRNHRIFVQMAKFEKRAQYFYLYADLIPDFTFDPGSKICSYKGDAFTKLEPLGIESK